MHAVAELRYLIDSNATYSVNEFQLSLLASQVSEHS